MNEQRWRQIDDVFQRALDQRTEERSAFLRDACGEDSELMREVDSLLSAHERAAPDLESPAHGGASRLLELDTQADVGDLIGSRLGAWRIIRALGSGGMGAVYLAERDDHSYEKIAALKLARRGLVGSSSTRREELQRRFQIERQVLASLEHPYIARLLDGGAAADGRPYFVMEYVEGATIEDYCAREKLGVPERLRLFVKVCEAVQHAHQNLVAHRDLKPSNILITAEGVPKLLDFGLAKLLEGKGIEASRHQGIEQKQAPLMPGCPAPADLRLDASMPALSAATVTGEFMGTFAFAAPEQVANLGAAPDTRSDVYSLGMILYRLLTGQHAYDVAGTITEVLHRITAQPPAPPSRVNPHIDDEMDTIVLKALAKEPARRYQSAGDLRADLERYLRGEPILAKGDSGWYVLRKHVRRYRAPLTVAGAFVMMVSGFAVIAALQAGRLAQQKATLAEALRISNIERGRAMGAIGNTALAEQLIWPAYLESSESIEETSKRRNVQTSKSGQAARDVSAPQRFDVPVMLRPDDQLAYWALWELYFNEPCLRTLDPEISNVNAAAVSFDGRWIVLTGRGHRPIVVDAQTGETQGVIEQDVAPWQSLSFRPGGRGGDLLAVAGDDGDVGVWDIATGRCVQRLAHGAPVLRVQFSADGDKLLSSAAHGVVLWDADSGEKLLSIAVEETIVFGIALSPDATRIAVGGDDGRAWLFDAATGQQLASFFDRGRRCATMCFSPDSRLLAADTDGTIVALIDLASNEIIARLTEPKGWIRALAFAPERDKGDPNRRSLGDWGPSGVRSQGSGTDEPHDAAFADGHQVAPSTYLLAAAGFDKTVHVWEVSKVSGSRRQVSEEESARANNPETYHLTPGTFARLVRRFRAHDAPVCAMQFSADGSQIISADLDASVKVWEIGRSPDAAAGHGPAADGADNRDKVFNSSLSASSSATSAAESSLSLGTSVPACLTFWPDFESIFDLLITPDGDHLITAGAVGQNDIRIRDANTGRIIAVLDGHDAMVASLALSPDGQRLASASYDGTIRMWELEEKGIEASRHRGIEATYSMPGSLDALMPASVWTTTPYDKSLNSVSWSPDGGVIAAAAEDGTVRLHRAFDGELVQTIDFECDRIPSLRFSPDGRFLAAALIPDNVVALIELGNGHQASGTGAQWLMPNASSDRRDLTGHEQSVRIVRFSPDGALLATAADDLTIRLWSMRPDTLGQCVATLSGHEQDIFALAFSADSALLASAGRGGTIKLWSVKAPESAFNDEWGARAARCLATLAGHRDMIFALALSADGTRLFSAGRAHSIGVWDLTYYDRHIAGNLAHQRRQLAR